MPSGWDEVAGLPRDDQGARTPGYPLLLDAVFWLTRHQPSPPPVIERASTFGFGVDSWHLDFLRSEENLRAVQAVQHLLGLFATWLAYAVVVRWTLRPLLAAVTAGVAVGCRPAWVALFEPVVLSEVLAGTLVLLCAWGITRVEQEPRGRVGWGVFASALSGAAVLVRPILVFVPLFVVCSALWIDRAQWRRVICVLCLPCVLLVGGWTVRNRIVYGFWGLSPLVGLNLVSHFRSHPEWFDAPIRELISEHRDDPFAGNWIAQALVSRQGLSLPQASSLLTQQSLRAMRKHAGHYLLSSIDAFKESWYPTEVLLPSPKLRARFPLLWRSYLGAYLLASAIGLLVLVRNAPYSAKASMALVLLFNAFAALLAHNENVRFAFPVAPIPLMSAAAVITYILCPLKETRPG